MTKKATTEKTETNSTSINNEINRNALSYITPKADIFAIDDGVNVVIDLPGVDENGLKVQIEKNILTIEAEIANQTTTTTFAVNLNHRTFSDNLK